MATTTVNSDPTTTTFAVTGASDYTVDFDGICFADIRATDRYGNKSALFVYVGEIPNLIADLTRAREEYETAQLSRLTNQ